MKDEGRLVDPVHINTLKSRFSCLDPKLQHVIRDIADEAHGNISMDPPTERRVAIARILLDIAEYEQHIDKDLIRSLCELRTGKQYKTAGAALSDMTWIDADRVWSTVLDITADRVTLEYIPESNHYTIKEKSNVR